MSLLLLVGVDGWTVVEDGCWVWVGAAVRWGWLLPVEVGGWALVGGECWNWVEADD